MIKAGDRVVFIDGRLATIRAKLENQMYHYIFTYDDDVYGMLQYAYEWELAKVG